MREIPISSAEADDNSAYISKGSAKQWYTYNESGSTTVHKTENGAWYLKVKEAKMYTRRYIPESEVYELTRLYRTSKSNPDFSRTIATIRACNEHEPKPHYLVMYRWAGEDQGPEDFVLPRHGNATRPTTNAYYRKDPKLLKEIDHMLEMGMSTDRVYSTIAKKKEETVSQTVTGPKVIDNRKYASKKASESNNQQDVRSEAEVLVSSLQTIPLVNSVTFSKEQYVSVNVLPNMLNDLFRFCVLGNAILRVDTTFELVDGLWLTDTTYTNEALIDLKGKHPEFPGPSFWHFRKTRESYRRFAGELVIQKPELLGLKKIGHDLDKALSNGFTDVFQDAKTLYCTQHMQERDAFKLHSVGCNQRSKQRIMADIYGSQSDVLLQSGLADAEDEDDFDVKLDSLKSVWEKAAPGFHEWFRKNRAQQFKESLIMSARKRLGIEGRFYTNGLELKHKLQKKRLREGEIPNEVACVSEELQTWSEEFYIEEARAIRGLGKYRLAPGYDHYHVDPTKWNRWSPERQSQHVNSFREFVPKSYDSYKKPSSAGHKTSPKSNKRRAELPEPEIFADRIPDVNPQAKKTAVSPLRLSKVGRSSQWQVRLMNNDYNVHLRERLKVLQFLSLLY